MREAGNRFAFAVTDAASGAVLGSTSYHDILPAVEARRDRLHLVRQALPAHARQHHLQAAAADARVRDARLRTWSAGAPTTSTTRRSAPSSGSARKKDGVIRHHALRRDGTIRDTVMYSIARGRVAGGQGAAALPAGQARTSPRSDAMLIDFFYTLRAAKLPVSVKEYLTLLEAMQAERSSIRPVGRRLLLPGAHRAGEGRGAASTSSTAPSPPTSRAWSCSPTSPRTSRSSGCARRSSASSRAEEKAQDREDGLGRADGDAEEALRGAEGAPRRRQQDGSAPAAPRPSAPTATTRRASASARTRAATRAR